MSEHTAAEASLQVRFLHFQQLVNPSTNPCVSKFLSFALVTFQIFPPIEPDDRAAAHQEARKGQRPQTGSIIGCTAYASIQVPATTLPLLQLLLLPAWLLAAECASQDQSCRIVCAPLTSCAPLFFRLCIVFDPQTSNLFWCNSSGSLGISLATSTTSILFKFFLLLLV